MKILNVEGTRLDPPLSWRKYVDIIIVSELQEPPYSLSFIVFI